MHEETPDKKQDADAYLPRFAQQPDRSLSTVTWIFLALLAGDFIYLGLQMLAGDRSIIALGKFIFGFCLFVYVGLLAFPFGAAILLRWRLRNAHEEIVRTQPSARLLAILHSGPTMPYRIDSVSFSSNSSFTFLPRNRLFGPPSFAIVVPFLAVCVLDEEAFRALVLAHLHRIRLSGGAAKEGFALQSISTTTRLFIASVDAPFYRWLGRIFPLRPNDLIGVESGADLRTWIAADRITAGVVGKETLIAALESELLIFRWSFELPDWSMQELGYAGLAVPMMEAGIALAKSRLFLLDYVRHLHGLGPVWFDRQNALREAKSPDVLPNPQSEASSPVSSPRASPPLLPLDETERKEWTQQWQTLTEELAGYSITPLAAAGEALRSYWCQEGRTHAALLEGLSPEVLLTTLLDGNAGKGADCRIADVQLPSLQDRYAQLARVGAMVLCEYLLRSGWQLDLQVGAPVAIVPPPSKARQDREQTPTSPLTLLQNYQYADEEGRQNLDVEWRDWVRISKLATIDLGEVAKSL